MECFGHLWAQVEFDACRLLVASTTDDGQEGDACWGETKVDSHGAARIGLDQVHGGPDCHLDCCLPFLTKNLDGFGFVCVSARLLVCSSTR